MFRIRDILVLIRIRGSVFLTNVSGSGSGYGSCSFASCQQDIIFFCIFLCEVKFTSFFKDKNSQNGSNKGFSYFFCLMMEGSGPERATNLCVPIRIRNTVLHNTYNWKKNFFAVFSAIDTKSNKTNTLQKIRIFF